MNFSIYTNMLFEHDIVLKKKLESREITNKLMTDKA